MCCRHGAQVAEAKRIPAVISGQGENGNHRSAPMATLVAAAFAAASVPGSHPAKALQRIKARSAPDRLLAAPSPRCALATHRFQRGFLIGCPFPAAHLSAGAATGAGHGHRARTDRSLGIRREAAGVEDRALSGDGRWLQQSPDIWPQRGGSFAFGSYGRLSLPTLLHSRRLTARRPICGYAGRPTIAGRPIQLGTVPTVLAMRTELISAGSTCRCRDGLLFCPPLPADRYFS